MEGASVGETRESLRGNNEDEDNSRMDFRREKLLPVQTGTAMYFFSFALGERSFYLMRGLLALSFFLFLFLLSFFSLLVPDFLTHDTGWLAGQNHA